MVFISAFNRRSCYLALVLALSIHDSYGESDRVRFGGNVVVDEGETVQTAVAIAGSVHVNGTVIANAVAVGGRLILGPTAVVGGNAVSIGGPMLRDPGAVVRGEVTEVGFGAWRDRGGEWTWARWTAWAWPLSIVSFLGFLALAVLLVSIFPRSVQEISLIVKQHPGRAVFWGGVGIMGIAPAALGLILTVVGILFLPLFFVAIGAAFVIGYIAAAATIGQRLLGGFGKEKGPLAETALGVTLLWLVGWAPVAGWIVKVIVSTVGFGSVLMFLVELRKRRATERNVQQSE